MAGRMEDMPDVDAETQNRVQSLTEKVASHEAELVEDAPQAAVDDADLSPEELPFVEIGVRVADIGQQQNRQQTVKTVPPAGHRRGGRDRGLFGGFYGAVMRRLSRSITSVTLRHDSQSPFVFVHGAPSP